MRTLRLPYGAMMIIGGFLLAGVPLFLHARQNVSPLSRSTEESAVVTPVVLVVGEPFTLLAETALPNPSFSWTLNQGAQRLAAQAERAFQYTFQTPGTYDLALTARSASGDETSSTFAISVEPRWMAGPQGEGNLQAILRSSPPADAQGIVRLPAKGGTVRLAAEESLGPIAEYGIDLSTVEDADGDGNAGNDVQNAAHASLRTGEIWQVSVRPAPGESERTVRLRVRDTAGAVSTADLTLRFDPELSLTPRLILFPVAASGEHAIRLPRAGGVVRLNAASSLGAIRRFALDLDTRRDSDGDGSAENDHDVLGTSFARDGSDLHIAFRPLPGASQRRIRLVIFAEDGSSSALEREVIFGSGGENGAGERPPAGSPELVSDEASLRVGVPFTLRILTVPPGIARFQWDLQSNGIADAETTAPFLLLEPDAPGILPVRVSLLDAAGTLQHMLAGEFRVLREGEVASNDSFQIESAAEGLTVSFSVSSGTGFDFTGVQPTWSFGDGNTSYLLSPRHTYAAPDAYEVTLTLEDIAQGIEVSTTTTEVAVSGVVPVPDAEEDGGGLSAIGDVFREFVSLFSSIFRIIGIAVLILLLPAGVVLLFLMLGGRKEGKTLSQVMQELRQQLSGREEKKAPMVSRPKEQPVARKEAPPLALPKQTPPTTPLPAPTPVRPTPPLTPNVFASPAAASQVPPERVIPHPSELPATKKEQDSLPPWLQKSVVKPPGVAAVPTQTPVQKQEPKVVPAPPPQTAAMKQEPKPASAAPAPSASPPLPASPPPIPSPSPASTVPPWLAKTMPQSVPQTPPGTPQKTNTPPPAFKKEESVQAPATSKAEMPWELGDDEPLAFIEAKDIEEDDAAGKGGT